MQDQRIHPENTSEANGNKDTKEEEKKYINTGLFWSLMIITFIIAAQNVVYISIFDSTLQDAMIPSIAGLSFLVFFLMSYLYGRSKWQVFQLCVLFDNILVATFIGLLGLGGFMYVLFGTGLATYKIFFLTLMLLDYFFLGGVFRILLASCFWKKWQIICCKVTLMVASLSYFYIAMSLIIVGLPESFGVTPEVTEKLIELSFLYVFGLFSFYYEIFNKLTDLDGTADLRYHYSILPKDESEEDSPKEHEPKNQTIFKINIEPNESSHIH